MSAQSRPAPLSPEDAFRGHREELLGLAYLMCGSRDASEDLVQTAFASAHERWATIENPVAYLKRSVINLAKDAQRRRFRAAARPVPASKDVALPPEVDETWDAVARLPWNQRAVIVLHYYEDQSLIDIAALLDRSAATIRSDHRRALTRLRRALG